MIAFAISLSLPAQAQKPQLPEQIAADKCDEVVAACDKVIEKQDALLLLQRQRLDQLRDDNEKLSEALVKLNRVQEQQTHVLVYASGGFLVGVITMLLVQGAK